MNAIAPIAAAFPMFDTSLPSPTDEQVLLALCADLGRMQREWQRLWDATSDELTWQDLQNPGVTLSPADREFDDYMERVWPGYQADPDTDPVRLLLKLRATTPGSQCAKAAAIKAISDVVAYSGCFRDDQCELHESLLADVAGDAAVLLGEEYTGGPA